MKPFVRNVFLAVLFAASALFHVPGVAQSMTLTVPFRGAGAMQVAQTVIELRASTIAAGATLTVETRVLTVAASGCVGLACSSTDTTPGGDDILVRRVDANRVQLVLTYLASFGVGPNYCSYLGGAGSRTYAISLSGFTLGGGTDGYRMTSFMAPSTESCDIAYTRVPAPRPTLAVNSGSVPRLGRLPLNVVLVLDKSPSMGWTIPGSADIRWDGLKGAAQLFTNVWDVIGAPPAPATISSEGAAEDRLGMLFFGGTVAESPLDGANFFKSRGSAASPWASGVASALAPLPGFISGTSIGAGAKDGRAQLNTLPNPVTGDSAILLFTDGEQNQPPCILHQGEVTTPTTKPYPGLPGVTYVDQCTVTSGIPSAPLVLEGARLAQAVLPRGPIFTIGLGEGGTAASALLLDRIAQETSGQSRYPLTSATLTQNFIDTLVDNLKGGTVAMMATTSGALATGVQSSPPLQVAVDPSVTRAVFVLAWKGPSREVEIEIRKPDGAVVASTLREASPGARVAAVNLPTDGPAGTWQVRVVRQGGVEAPALQYQLSAYAVESRLSARITQSPRLGTAQPVKLVAEVGWGDDGLDGLPPGAIVATIERPPENLGNLLAAPITGKPPPAQLDASPLMVKFHQLAAAEGFLDRISPRPLAQKVELVNVGKGRYEGSFDGAIVGGQYRIRVDFDWTDPRTDRIRRIHVAERQVAVVPTADRTAVQVQREPRSTTAIVIVTPQDGRGNVVGPGFEGQFNVRANGATVASLDDFELRGAYAIRLTGIAPDGDPDVKIDYGGVTLRDGPLSQLPSGSQSFAGGGGRMAVWLALGSTFPHSSFSNGFKGSFAGNIGFEYGLDANAAIEATLGYHQFKGKNSAPDVDVTQYGIGAKWYFAVPWRPFVTAGIGGYSFDPGSSRFGGWVGVGAQVPIDAHWSIEGRYNYHMVSGNSPNSQYSTLQLGVRYGF